MTLAALQPDFQVFRLAMELLGGLALFLYGMDKMSEALKLAAGTRLKTILEKLTGNRLMGVLSGAFVTAAIQSSSVTTVLVVGFISAGVMSLSQSIGVIMGANIGTTITGQIIAFQVTRYALGMIAVGFGLVFLTKRESLRVQGRGIMGLGLVFLGMGIMAQAMAPLRDYAPFLEGMRRMAHPAYGILAGMLFTALVQSSSATTGIVIVMASEGLISLPAGIAISFGANVGTCITAVLATLGKPREALRAAMVHVLFNVGGVLVWLALIDELAIVVSLLSPETPGLQGMEKLAADTPRQIANAHTIFNVANTLLFIGFATQMARVVEWLVPDRPLEGTTAVRIQFLDDALVSTPALALDRARMELALMGERVTNMMSEILPAFLGGTRAELEAIRDQDDTVDQYHGHIVTYLGKVSQQKLTDQHTAELLSLLEAVNDLENIGDLIETNLVRNGLQRIKLDFTISPMTRNVIADFHKSVSQALQQALAAVTQHDAEKAEAVFAMDDRILAQGHSASRHQSRRLVVHEPNRLPAYSVEVDALENLKRIHHFARRMARTLRPPETGSPDEA